MSQVAPNGQIRFLSQVPLDKNYENSIDFLTELAQRTYFLGLTPVHTQANAVYIRDGVIRVDASRDTILNCNYIMFQNTNFSNKWFYAFIVEPRYINNNTCEVEYKIDDVQTYMFDTTLRTCFVEREHTPTDALFEHLVDEGLSVSEMKTLTTTSREFKEMYAVMFVADRLEEDPDTGRVIPEAVGCLTLNGVLTGVGAHGFKVKNSDGTWNQNGVDALTQDIIDYNEAQAKDSILGIIVYPSDLLNFEHEGQALSDYGKTTEISYTNFNSSTPLDGNYVPVNKKLYNAPYCSVEIISSDGQKINLQPELIEQPSTSGTNPYVRIYSNMSMNPSALLVVTNYAGDETAWDKNMNIDCFPQCAVALDGYLAWVASGGLDMWTNHLYTNAISSGLNILGAGTQLNKNPSSALTTGLNVAQIGVSSFSDINKSIIELDVAKSLPSDVKGKLNTTPLTNYSRLEIMVKKRCAKKDILQSIDNYFTMFGYKINKVKQPSRRNRPHYTYLKTKGIHIDGNAPADAIERLEAIYDNGIRFWTTPSEVGDFTVNNAPT